MWQGLRCSLLSQPLSPHVLEGKGPRNFLWNSKRLPFIKDSLCASHALSCKCSHLFSTTTAWGVSHNYPCTHEEPEAQVWKLPGCTEELAGARAKSDMWGCILSTGSGLVLERPRDSHQRGLNHSCYMRVKGWLGVWEEKNLALISSDIQYLIVSLILRRTFLVRVYWLWNTLHFPSPFHVIFPQSQG